MARLDASASYYYHADHLGSTSVATDVSGATAEEVHYYPFGATRDRIGNVSLNHKYTSQELDPESGLYYYGARYYDPELGRFIPPDSIVPYPNDPQSFNRYSYVRNNPLNLTDPSGNIFGIDDLLVGIIVGAIIGATTGSVVAAATGGDVLQGALWGAGLGALGGGLGTYAGASLFYIGGDVGISSIGATTAGAFIGGAAGGAAGGAISPTASQPANQNPVLHFKQRAPGVQQQPEDYHDPSNSFLHGFSDRAKEMSQYVSDKIPLVRYLNVNGIFAIVTGPTGGVIVTPKKVLPYGGWAVSPWPSGSATFGFGADPSPGYYSTIQAVVPIGSFLPPPFGLALQISWPEAGGPASYEIGLGLGLGPAAEKICVGLSQLCISDIPITYP